MKISISILQLKILIIKIISLLKVAVVIIFQNKILALKAKILVKFQKNSSKYFKK
jgi:hypothetical protein